MNRSKWKGPFIDVKEFKKTRFTQKPNQKKLKFTISRNSEIVPTFIGLTFIIHNGKKYNEITVSEDMVGHKFGEFSFTRSKFSFKKKK